MFRLNLVFLSARRLFECVWKAFLSGFSTSEISLREGEAPAEPKISAGREMGKNLGSPGGSPSH